MRSGLLSLLFVIAVVGAPLTSQADPDELAAPDSTDGAPDAPPPALAPASGSTRVTMTPLGSATPSTFTSIIRSAATRYRIPERLVQAIITVESGFDVHAVSKTGAQGLMQLMPETAAILGVEDAFDPAENIQAGVRHLRGMMTIFRGDLPLALAAYHAGPSVVAMYRGVPPYPETREYVARVLQLAGLRFQRLHKGHFRLTTREGVVTYTNVHPSDLK
jgi:soluble lytic murein transglycosylase-like protein